MNNHFSAYIDHKVADTLLLQKLGYDIYCISFCHSAAREHYTRVCFHHFPFIGQFYFFVSCHLQQAVYHGRVGEVTLLEPKSPGIGKRGNGDIEGTIGLPGDFHATSEDVGKECVGHNVLVAVDARNGRRVIERGQGTVETFEFRFYLRLQILVTLISHFIYRTEYQSVIRLIRSDLVVAGKYPDGSQYQ